MLSDDDPDTGPVMPTQLEAFDLLVPFVETLLDGDPDEVPLSLLAQLVGMARMPAIPEPIALQIAFGRRIGEQHARKIARLVAQARQRALTVDEHIEHLRRTGAVPHDTLVRLFLGDARRRPDTARIRAGVAVLRRAVSLLPPPVRPDLLCILGWLSWADGDAETAMDYVETASAIAPGHVLAYGLGAIIGTGKVPAWVTPERVRA